MMEDGLLEEDTSAYASMGLEERRALNISRQQQYLDALFGSKARGKPEPDDSSSMGLQDSSPKPESTTEDIYGRDGEISKLRHFLARDFDLPDAFVMYGPSGTGKTSIVRSVLRKFPTPSCMVLCSGYSTVRQLIRAIWMSLQTTQVRGDGFNLPEIFRGQVLIPSTCEELVEYVSKLSTSIILFLDKIDVVDELQNELSHMLLSIPETSNNSKLKVIGTATTYRGWRTFLTELRPYSDYEIECILKLKANYLEEPLRSEAMLSISQSFRHLLFSSRHCGQLWYFIQKMIKFKVEQPLQSDQMLTTFSSDSWWTSDENHIHFTNECERAYNSCSPSINYC